MSSSSSSSPPRTNSVAQLQFRPILLHRAPTKPKSSRSNAHRRFPRFRSYSPSDSKTSRLLWPHALHLHLQPLLSPKCRTRSVPRRAAQPALRPARRARRTRARERRALRACAWRRGHATRRQRRFFAQDEETCRAGERGTRHARRLGRPRTGIARRMDMGCWPRRRRG
jgi:hypothetical protein